MAQTPKTIKTCLGDCVTESVVAAPYGGKQLGLELRARGTPLTPLSPSPNWASDDDSDGQGEGGTTSRVGTGDDRALTADSPSLP